MSFALAQFMGRSAYEAARQAYETLRANDPFRLATFGPAEKLLEKK